jgi:two-component system LytT family response regulator
MSGQFDTEPLAHARALMHDRSMTAHPIRAMIVDDDALARQRLRLLIDAHPDVRVVRECADGREAVDALAATDVDLVFLDVQMPRLDGFGVLAEVGAKRMPPVIFTSAYTEFAVRAFEAYALDYLLKPFDDTRFAVALKRARDQIDGRRRAELDHRMLGLLEHLQHPVPTTYPDAIAIRTGAQYVLVRVSDIDWIEANGNYAKLFVDRRPRLLTKTLATLEREVLDPSVFVRVHRSAIVNTRKIAGVEAHRQGELTLVLRDGTRVDCSRRYRAHLEQKLYFTS